MDVIEYGGLLNKEFCDLIIQNASKRLEPAKVVGENNNIRIADDTWLTEKELPELKLLREWIAGTTSLPVENQETGTVIRYSPGGKYDLHYDYFESDDVAQARELNFGGNRVYSFLVYLNEDFEGGETHFPYHNLKVKPEIGKAVLWKNTEEGTLLKESKHAGEPVITGYKWVYITWIREREYNETNHT